MNCPKCSRTLIEKWGIYGIFLACPGFPDCRYTRSHPTHCPKCNDTGCIITEKIISSSPSLIEAEDIQTPCDCEWAKERGDTNCVKCNDTGLLPFVKNGRTIPNAFINCECHIDEPEINIYHPEDFDFPMSYSFYRSLCRQHDWTDPGPARPPEPEPPRQVGEIIHRYSDMGKQEYALLQQTALKADHLDKKLAEHLAEKQRRKSKHVYQ